MTTAAVILAAGGGSRFGGPDHKLRAPLDRRPIITWSVDAAQRSGLDETVVVVGDDDFADLLDDRVSIVVNEAWRSGQASSLQAAVRHAERRDHDAIVVGVADQPFVGAACWSAVAAERSTPVAAARFDAGLRPPVRLHRDVWGLLPAEGDAGARTLLRSRPELVTAVPCHSDPMDVDTTEDYARADRRAGDLAAVTSLLGRAPRGRFEVVVRDDSDRPVVLRNHPLLEDGTPMPTRYWLCGEREQALVGRLESHHGVRRAEREVGLEVIAEAHDRYARERDAVLADTGAGAGPRPTGGVGGTRVGVKCLHAHYAWWLAGGDDPVGQWVADHLHEVEGSPWPRPQSEDR